MVNTCEHPVLGIFLLYKGQLPTRANLMGFIILCVRELLGDISTIHLLRGTLVALPYQLMLDISPVRAVGAKNKTHPVFIHLFGVNNSPGSDFHIFGDVLHWVSLLQRHFHCLISGLAATRACASISGSACNQLVDWGPLLKVKLKGGVQGIIRDYQRLASHNSSNFSVSKWCLKFFSYNNPGILNVL